MVGGLPNGEFAAMQKPQLDRLLFDLTGLRPGAHRDHRARPTGNVNRQLVSPVESPGMHEASPAARACKYGTETSLGIKYGTETSLGIKEKR